MKLLIASNNINKIKEIREILNDSNIEILSLDDLGIDIEVIEDADTFEGNARKKANEIFSVAKIPTIADDSGLMVESLDGRPGVLSARYAGKDCTYADNNKKLLGELKNIPIPHRAKFVSVINLKTENLDEIFDGVCDGEIVDYPRGTNGFGYDPVFRPDGYDLTYAELSSEVKNKISHRAKALAKLSSFLHKLENF
jgi:XTP/dITP diphosphohydrolase